MGRATELAHFVECPYDARVRDQSCPGLRTQSQISDQAYCSQLRFGVCAASESDHSLQVHMRQNQPSLQQGRARVSERFEASNLEGQNVGPNAWHVSHLKSRFGFLVFLLKICASNTRTHTHARSRTRAHATSLTVSISRLILASAASALSKHGASGDMMSLCSPSSVSSEEQNAVLASFLSAQRFAIDAAAFCLTSLLAPPSNTAPRAYKAVSAERQPDFIIQV